MLTLLFHCVAPVFSVFFPLMQRIPSCHFFKWIDPPTFNSPGEVLPVLVKELNNLDIEIDTLIVRVYVSREDNVKNMDRVKQLENECDMNAKGLSIWRMKKTYIGQMVIFNFDVDVVGSFDCT